MAARFYFLFLIRTSTSCSCAGGSKSTRYGFDFSRNITTNLEIHGELAWIRDFHKIYIDPDGRLFRSLRTDVWSYLLGIRYLSARETTYIFEYYRNGTGFKEEQMRDYFSFIDRGYDAYLSTGDDALLRRARI
jgi:hypothetical protein